MSQHLPLRASVCVALAAAFGCTQPSSTDGDAGSAPAVGFLLRVCMDGAGCGGDPVIDLGDVVPGARLVRTVRVRNDGTAAGVVSAMRLRSAGVDVQPTYLAAALTSGSFPLTLAAGASATLTVTLAAGQPPGSLPADTLAFSAVADDGTPGSVDASIRGRVKPCATGFDSCNETWEDGCEADLTSQVDHCGSCATPCLVDHGTAVCQDRQCRVTCHRGYHGVTCADDDDECAADPGPCPEHATCANTPGSYSCACVDGYVDRGGSCGLVACPSHASGAPVCVCDQNYTGALAWDAQRSSWTGVCNRTVACTPEDNTCDAHAACQVNGTCACLPGYTGDGATCTLAPCPAHAAGAPACTCRGNTTGTLTWDDAQDLWTGTCTENPGCADCSAHAVCNDDNGTPTCACIAGYTGDGVTCALATCPENGTGAPNCACRSGYLGTPTWNTGTQAWDGLCTDDNECDLTPRRCDVNAECHNTAGSYDCACHVGYQGDGASCLLVACPQNAQGAPNCACSAGATGALTWSSATQTWQGTCSSGSTCPANNSCDDNADCTLVEGAETCVCRAGYTGNGATCTLASCPVGAGGAPTCACLPDYEGTLWWDDVMRSWAGSCDKVRGCDTAGNPCAEQASCEYNGTNYTCTCRSGYTGSGLTCGLALCPQNATGEPNCACERGTRGALSWDDEGQMWTGTCAVASCPDGASGAPDCTCDAGYRDLGLTWDSSAGAWTGQCVDIDECDPWSPTHDCDANARCGNTPGGFTCTCNGGYQGTGVVCTLENLCQREPSVCPPHSDCHDLAPGFSCTCKTGYLDDVTGCVQAACPEHAVNAPSCACAEGWLGTLTWDASTGWSGTCVDRPECETHGLFCDTHATCTDLVGSYSCACQDGYTGDGLAPNGCALADCPPHASGAPACACDEDAVGALTWDDVTTSWTGTCVLKNPCNTNTSTCGTTEYCVSDGGQDFHCVACGDGQQPDGARLACELCPAPTVGTGGACPTTCGTGFTRNPSLTACLNIDDCPASHCANGSTCVDGIDDYACACTVGWMGKDCDVGILVNSIPDVADGSLTDGTVSLRDAAALATVGAHIGFAAELAGAVLPVTAPIVVNKSLTINGMAQAVVLDGGAATDLIQVVDGDVTIRDLGLKNGKARGTTHFLPDGITFGMGGGGGGAGLGGAVSVLAGNVTLRNLVFTHNNAAGGNGGDSTQDRIIPMCVIDNGGVCGSDVSCTSNHWAGWGGVSNLAGPGCLACAGACINPDPYGRGNSNFTPSRLGDTCVPCLASSGRGGGWYVSPAGTGMLGGGGGGGGAQAYDNQPGGAGGLGGGGGGGAEINHAGGAGGLGGGRGGDGVSSNNAGGGGGGAGLGGALSVLGGTVTVRNCSFAHNGVTGGAGGTVKGTGQRGTRGLGLGGAVFVNAGATLDVADSVFDGNTSSMGNHDVWVTQGSTAAGQGLGSLPSDTTTIALTATEDTHLALSRTTLAAAFQGWPAGSVLVGITVVTTPTSGHLAAAGRGVVAGQDVMDADLDTLTYRAWDNYPSGQTPGADSFTFRGTFMVPGTGLTFVRQHGGVAVVSLSVTPAADPPWLSDVPVVLDAGSSVAVTLSQFQAHFWQQDDQPISTVKVVTLPAHGTLKLDGTDVVAGQEVPAAEVDNLVYSPATCYFGGDSFQWTATSGWDGWAVGPAAVSINVRFVNYATLANDDTAATWGELAVHIPVLANDTDLCNPPITPATHQVSVVTAPPHGTYVIQDGVVIYTPGNVAGVATFTYQVNDGLLSNVATVSVTVTHDANPDSLLINNLADEDDGAVTDGDITLREALRFVTAARYRVRFDPAVAGGTLTVSKPVSITAAAPLLLDGETHNIKLSGGDLTTVLVLRSGTLTVQNLTVTHGLAAGTTQLLPQGMWELAGAGGGGAGMGGAVFAEGGSLTLSHVNFTQNTARGGDGGDMGFELVGANTYGRNIDRRCGAGVCSCESVGGNGGVPSHLGCSLCAGFDPVTWLSSFPDGDAFCNACVAGSAAAGGWYEDGGDGGFGGGGGGGGSEPGRARRVGAGGFGGGGGGGPGDIANSAGGAGGFAGGAGAAGGPDETYKSGGGGGGGGMGGALFVKAGTVTVDTCAFSNNTARAGVGGLSVPPLANGNPGQGHGGAVFVHDGATVHFTATTFSSNAADTSENDVYVSAGATVTGL